MNINYNYCVILAGGRGRRLWPSSRRERPKQFIDFFGTGRSLLQSTFDRIARILPPDHIYICTERDLKSEVCSQLPEVPSKNILAEPVNRNTAPAVAWAGWRIHRECDDARVIILPSDQLILNEETFAEDIQNALDYVSENNIMLTMGVKPTRPEPGYGYIQMGDLTENKKIFKVKSFTEKPERDFARMFMESGEFLWNTGIFLTNVRHLREWFLTIIKDLGNRLSDIPVHYSIEREEAYVMEHFPLYPNLSMDKGVLEQTEEVYVMQCSFGWADIGTWHAIFECMQKTEHDNVVLDSEVIMEDCRNNIVRLPQGHVGVINGLDGYIIAEQGDVLLICKKEDSSALIRKYANEVGLRYGEEYV